VISSIIVIASLVLGLAFVVAWCCSPPLRRWVERPKYQFLTRVQQHDRARGRHS
jgi:hypothetical protein